MYLNQKYRNAALKATKQAVKTTQGAVTAIHAFNQDSTDTFLQIYDVASAGVTVGTTTPTLTLWVPASSGLDIWVNANSDEESCLFQFGTALTIAATTTVGGSTNPTNGLLLNLVYV